MTGIRITTRTNLKLDMANIYDAINENNPVVALRHLDSAEKNIVVYYNTRGLTCERFFPIFSRIRNFLKRFNRSRLYKKRVFHYLFELNNELRAPADITGKKDKKQDINLILKHLSDDLMDDYSEFNCATGQEHLEKNREVLDLIRSDLLEMKELESVFSKEGGTLKTKYSRLLIAVNNCLVILPQVNDVSISANTVKAFRSSFEALFNMLSEIFLPVEIKEEVPMAQNESLQFDLLSPVDENKKTVQETEPLEKKSLNKMAEELGMNLKEMERKAKEGLSVEPDEDKE